MHVITSNQRAIKKIITMPPSLTGSRAKLSSNAQTSFAQTRGREGQRLERPNDALKHGANMCLASRSHLQHRENSAIFPDRSRLSRFTQSTCSALPSHRAVEGDRRGTRCRGGKTTLGSPMSLKRQGIEPRNPACLDDR